MEPEPVLLSSSSSSVLSCCSLEEQLEGRPRRSLSVESLSSVPSSPPASEDTIDKALDDDDFLLSHPPRQFFKGGQRANWWRRHSMTAAPDSDSSLPLGGHDLSLGADDEDDEASQNSLDSDSNEMFA